MQAKQQSMQKRRRVAALQNLMRFLMSEANPSRARKQAVTWENVLTKLQSRVPCTKLSFVHEIKQCHCGRALWGGRTATPHISNYGYKTLISLLPDSRAGFIRRRFPCPRGRRICAGPCGRRVCEAPSAHTFRFRPARRPSASGRGGRTQAASRSTRSEG